MQCLSLSQTAVQDGSVSLRLCNPGTSTALPLFIRVLLSLSAFAGAELVGIFLAEFQRDKSGGASFPFV